ncbi:MAG: integral rane sensor signal transduction histidine kinase, partial [Acidimicrobiales bacterium]|nr:integral rane sensor signal transduction histidine kinase [Acidimicrobiales bacterium]
YSDVRSGKDHLRVLTRPLERGSALQVARSLEEVDRDLRRLALIFGAVALGGVALAAGLGWVVARTALVPLARINDTMEDVGETVDLSRRVEPSGPDELGRLSQSFNRLLAALEESRREQHQLVTDASHELRTPLTSLRTNVEVLRRMEELPPTERQQLLSDLLAQVDELTGLVGSLVELARGDGPETDAEDLALDELVADVVARAETHARTRDVSVEMDLQPSHVHAGRARVERAVANLLDNAVKWSPTGGIVEIDSRDGRVTVRDHGQGIAPEDLAHIFDRFYRAPAARGLPGSGLGLAIARQVAEAEGGSASAANHPEGGAVVELRIPPLPKSSNGARRRHS